MTENKKGEALGRGGKCTHCQHEKVEWLPFHKIAEEYYCEMCITLGLMCLKRDEELKENSVEIDTTGKLKCDLCCQPAKKDMPVIVMGRIKSCPVCAIIAIELMEEQSNIAEKYLPKDLN